MIRSLIFIFLGINFTFCLQLNKAKAQRIKQSINEHWQFIRKDVADGPTATPDSSWKTVNLPHTWNDEDAFNDKPGYYRGLTWYHKALHIPADWKSKQLFLHFEGANQIADVYVNGQKVTHHVGGYTAFTANITQAVQFGDKNNIAVRVDNSHNHSVPPLNADFTFFGGIYRDVWLVAMNPVHLQMDKFGSPGVFIRTPQVSQKSAAISIRSAIQNDSDEPANIDVKQTIYDPGGAIVKTFKTNFRVDAHQNRSFKQQSSPIKNPQLWSPDSPKLYTVETELISNDKILDQTKQPLGLRWYRFDPDEGFFLNGKHLKLRGTNRHQVYPSIGNALPDELHVRDLELVKEMGANFMRLTHYPQDPAVLNAADRLGLLIWEEIPIVNYITPSKKFTQNAVSMVKEMVYQHYNHPAIILWGYMNEIFLFNQNGKFGQSEDSTYTGAVVALADSLNSVVHEIDPGRKTVMAMHQNEIYSQTGIADIPDVIGWNLYFGWYNGTFADLGPFLDNQHQRFPSRVHLVSEFGAGSDSRIHSYNPERFDFSAEYQRAYHESYLRQIEERPFIAGSAIWIQFDFASESRNDSRPWINQKGIMHRDRSPKDIYYFYQAHYSDQAVVHLALDNWTHRSAPENPQDDSITVYSNLPQVELFLNGKSLGKKSPGTPNKAEWPVDLKSGKNELQAIGYRGDQQFDDEATIEYQPRPKAANLAKAGKGIAVNAGAHVQFLPGNGRIWIEDQSYNKNDWGYSGGEAKLNHHNILNTDREPLYQWYREGMNSYSFDAPDGRYEVQLYFTEPEFSEAGKRIFSVSVSDQKIFKNLDLAEEFGRYYPVSKKVIVDAKNGAGITISFQSQQGKPIISGVRIKEI